MMIQSNKNSQILKILEVAVIIKILVHFCERLKAINKDVYFAGTQEWLTRSTSIWNSKPKTALGQLTCLFCAINAASAALWMIF